MARVCGLGVMDRVFFHDVYTPMTNMHRSIGYSLQVRGNVFSCQVEQCVYMYGPSFRVSCFRATEMSLRPRLTCFATVLLSLFLPFLGFTQKPDVYLVPARELAPGVYVWGPRPMFIRGWHPVLLGP